METDICGCTSSAHHAPCVRPKVNKRDGSGLGCMLDNLDIRCLGYEVATSSWLTASSMIRDATKGWSASAVQLLAMRNKAHAR